MNSRPEEGEAEHTPPSVDDEVLPSELDTAPTKLVYLYLHVAGAGTAGELRRALDVGLLTLYPVLRTLVRRGHVQRVDGTYRLVDA